MKVADQARILAATTKPGPGPGPGPQGDLGRLRRRNRRGSALGERAEGAAYPARRCLSVSASRFVRLTGGCLGQRAPSPA